MEAKESRINLSLYCIKNKSSYNNNDPIPKLLNTFNDLKIILKEKDNSLKIYKFFCFYKDIIHKILYNDEEIIIIIQDEQKKSLAFNFYLNLLINYNPEVINYSFSFEYINYINEETKNIKDKFKLVLLAKCILSLITNYKGLEDYDDENQQELERIESENKKIIYDNLGVFKKIGLNLDEKKIESIKIDELYMKIIKQLIINRKFEDYEYTYNIFNQIEIININLIKEMIDELFEILNEKEEYISDYLILNQEDLFNEKKMNFYFFLLKYILKTPFYIYQFPFLLKTKKNILEQFKLNKLNSRKINRNNNDKLNYIIGVILDSDFYETKYINNQNNIKEILKEIKRYYEEFSFKSKKEDIINIEEIIKNNNYNYDNNNEFEKYLKDYELAIKMNLRAPIINYLYIKKNKSDIKDEEKFKNEVTSWENMEKMIMEHKSKKKMYKINKMLLFNYFNEEKNKNIINKIFNKDDIDFFIKEVSESLNKGKKMKNIKEDNNKNIINEKDNKKENDKNIINKKLIDNIQNKKIEENINILEKNKNNNQNNISHEESKSTAISFKYYSNINYNIKNEENMMAPSPVIKPINNYDDIITNILKKCSIKLSTNENKNDNYFIYENILYGNYGIELNYEKLIELKGIYMQIQKENYLANNFILFLNFLKQFEDTIKKEFLYNYKLNFKLKFAKEIYNNNTNCNIDNITCVYIFYEPINNTPKTFKEDNILINGINSISQGFEFMKSDINSEIYKNIEYKKYNQKNQIDKVKLKKDIINSNKDKVNANMSKIIENENKEIKDKNLNIFEESTKMNSYYDYDNYLGINASKYSIIEFIQIIGTHENPANFVTELDNNYFLSGGCEKTLILYEKMTEKIKIKDLDDWTYKVTEKITYDEKNNKIQLLCCTNKELIKLNIDKTTFRPNITKYQLPKRTISNCIEMKENNMIIMGHGGASYFIDIFNKNNQLSEYKISEKTFRGGIRINDKTVVLTSNSVLHNGEDILIFYNIKTKKITNIIEGYSSTISTNNLSLIPREEIKSNNKVLLCACKKYNNNKNKKNGILLVNANLGDNKRMEKEFYDTNNFEVYCFCPILKFEKNNKNKEMDNKKGSKIIDTNYVFVGGFDLDMRCGKIKLYKIVYGEKIWNTTIKFMQDIEINENNKFEDFDGPISSIIQSKANGLILASCYNGNVYLFTSPNMEYYTD